jgi:CDP-diacylglycerol---serine O-phosphatidyltransferase
MKPLPIWRKTLPAEPTGKPMERRLPPHMSRSRRALAAARRRTVPLRALVPNIVTLIGLCVGLTSIRMAIENRFDIALAAIVIAALLDGVDGRMARLLKASSRFGAELDSLADFVNFGVAPALVLYLWAFGDLRSLGWIVVLVFALAAALRLARFNVAIEDPDKPMWQNAYFVGVPVPAGAILVLLPMYLEALGLPKSVMYPQVLAIYAIGIGVLMVSRIRTFSGKLIGRRIAREYIAPVVVLAVALAALLATYPYLMLAAGSLLYLAMIPFSIREYRKTAKHPPAPTPALGHDGAQPPEQPRRLHS